MTTSGAGNVPIQAPADPRPRPLITLLRRLRSLNPVGLPGSGPWALFQKDVRSAGRRRLTYWARGLYASAFAGLVGLVLIAVISDSPGQSTAASLQQIQRIAPILATSVLWFQYVGLCFAAPLLTGPTLCEERRSRTLPALLTTPLSAGQIVIGKFMGALSQLLVFALVPVPVLLASRVFGGLDASAVLAGTAVAVGAAILAGSWAMIFSLNASRGVSAAMAAWSMMLFFHFLVPLVAVSPIGLTRLGIPTPPWLGPSMCPPMALFTISQQLTGAATPAATASITLLSVGGSLGVSLLLWLVTTVSLRSALTRTGGEFQTKAELRREARALRRAAKASPQPAAPSVPQAAAQPARTPTPTAHRSRVIGDHPVLWREIRQPAFGSRTRLVVIAVAALIVVGAVYWIGGISDPLVHQAVAIISMLIFAATACVSTTPTIGGERDARTWDVLLTTPLSPRRIIWGKFVGGMARLWPVPLVMAVCLLVVAPIGGMYSPLPLTLYFCSFPPVAAILCATGVFWSLVIRRVTLASVVNFLLAASFWLGLPLFVTVFFEIAGNSDMAEQLVGALFSANPVALGITASSRLGSYVYLGGGESFDILSMQYPPLQFVTLCIGVWATYGLIAVVILEAAARRLAATRDKLA
ncbi:MAG: ABC transporter permease subunit [Phycisphaerales bacterium]|nr:ABC transporter permease subunit [Phycisphaerales bacterium]